MSVLIKGMDMPKEGGVIVIYKEGNSFYTAKAGEGRRYPLIPVPPHGRLIDADEVPYFASAPWKAIATQSEIERMPTIIEAEEGEGE